MKFLILRLDKLAVRDYKPDEWEVALTDEELYRWFLDLPEGEGHPNFYAIVIHDNGTIESQPILDANEHNVLTEWFEES